MERPDPPGRLPLNWREWHLPFESEPVFIRPLSSGRTNKSYLVRADGSLYVIRIGAVNSRELGIDRKQELAVMDKAGEAGLAPRVLHASPDQGLLVTEFLDGRHWQPGTVRDPDKLSMLLNLLERLHAIEVRGDSFDYHAHLLHYWEILEANGIRAGDELLVQRERMLQVAQAVRDSTVLCHHDPNPGNVLLYADALYLLDWEYAAPGWRALDYAALAMEWGIATDGPSLPGGLDRREFEAACGMYRHLCGLWSCVNSFDPGS